MVAITSAQPTTAEVLVVDDHPLVAMALETALRRQGLDAIHIEPGDTERLRGALDAGPPGLLVLDLDLGDGADGHRDGVALIAQARRAGWTVLVSTGSADRRRIAHAIAEGALGWVEKSQPFEQLLATIEAVAGGEQVFDPALRAELVASIG
jgi:two-component system nitrate/nitrite response regulator NarL